MNAITKDEVRDTAMKNGISVTKLAEVWGHSRQWMYSGRETPLPAVYRYALAPTIQAIKEEDQ